MFSLTQPFNDIFISVVSNGQYFVDDLFKKKFGNPAPDYGHSVIAFYRKNQRQFIPVSYANFLPHDEVLLGGGAMTDEFAFRKMPPDLFSEIKNAGGIYVHVLKYAIYHFRDDCEAFFGYAGDKLAYEVDIRAGFEPTPFKFLVAHFHKPISDERKRFLIEKVNKVGPF